MTIPDKPNSRLQKYRLTDKGFQWLRQRAEGVRRDGKPAPTSMEH